MSRRDEYIAKMKEQLDHLNAQLGELEEKADAATQDAKHKYEEQMAEMRQMAKSGQQKLEELKSAGEDQWERLVAEGGKVYKAFIHSYNYFKSQLKK